MAADSISFNSIDLNDKTTFITSSVDDSSPPTIALSAFNLARAPGGVVTDRQYGLKPIIVTGKIVGNGLTAFENNLDTFNGVMAVQNKNLDLGYAGGTRRYICTPQSVSVSRPVRAASWANFEVKFVATEYGKDTSTTSLHTGTITASPYVASSLTIGGNAPLQMPKISLTMTTITPGTTNTLTFKNTENNAMITIQRTWVQGDVLVIDPANFSITVNGTLIDWTGPFLYFAPGSRTISITNNFSGTKSLALVIDYVKRWL